MPWQPGFGLFFHAWLVGGSAWLPVDQVEGHLFQVSLGIRQRLEGRDLLLGVCAVVRKANPGPFRKVEHVIVKEVGDRLFGRAELGP